MTNLTSVGVTNGVPSSGTGNVSTIDNLIGTSGSGSTNLLTVQGDASGTAVPVSGTFFQTTQPVSATTLPLPTGASTAALQPTAAAQGSTTSGQTGTLVQGAVTTSTPTYTNAQTSPLSLDTTGALRVNIAAGSGGVVTQPTAANLNATVVQAGTWTVQPGNTANTTAWKVDGSAVTQPVSGTLSVNALPTGSNVIGHVISDTGSTTAVTGTVTVAGTVTTTPPSNASTNVAQVAGTTTDTNSGAKSAGTLRVVLATDQPALTNKLLVTPDSVALPANQSVNVAQFGGVSTSTGQVAVNVAPVTATNTALVVGLRPDSPGIIALGQATKSASVPVTIASDQGLVVAQSGPYPSGATPITSSATGTTAATVATLAGTSGKTTYICGFTITADATAAIAGAATVAGTISGSLNYIQSVGAATSAQLLTQNFIPPIPASATNTAITVTSAAAGTGGNTAVTAWGYQL